MKSRSAPRLRMLTNQAFCAALVAGSAMLGLCGNAHAQFAFEDEILPPRVVAWRLADRGFTDLSRPRFDGRVYVVDAVSPTGAPVRLLVDPAAGAIVGQRRVNAPETYARLERPAPGFGWTEEEAAPRRVARPSPFDETQPLRLQRRPAGEAMRPELNPDGVNPDAGGRSGVPRKVARAVPAKPPELRPSLRTSPEAPAPTVAPAEAGKAGARRDAKADVKADPREASIGKAQPATPGAAAPDKPAETVVAEAPKPAPKDWKDPPSEKKPVRVIGGATIVPGTVDRDQGAAQ
ncbi:hypothetical protein FOHLNKBM_1473 [Methylobacterium longum]|uniref:PepSY domain-containing protein n=2 Tax=Methylobacteriaceae TaxID=119045 RepID=A0ABT8AGU7_9HYPH|nr:hypothetical protein [Methylobacterium longum]GJE10439.1 hypothetical protein FOHLNKBM_1473 [Methylobacterium longum]